MPKLDAGAIRKAKAAAGPGIKPGTYRFTLTATGVSLFQSLLRDSRKFREAVAKRVKEDPAYAGRLQAMGIKVPA